MIFIVAIIGKQPIYAGDIQSDIHSSKRKSERLKEKIRTKRQKIFAQGSLGHNGDTNGNDTRTRSFIGISKGTYTKTIIVTTYIDFIHKIYMIYCFILIQITRIMEIQFSNVKTVMHYYGMQRVLWGVHIHQSLGHSRYVVAEERLC